MKDRHCRWVHTVSVPLPTLENNTADAERLVESLRTRLETDSIDIDLGLLRHLPDILRNRYSGLRCVLFRDRRRWILIHVLAAEDESATVAGLAVDLGTTRVVLRLQDLSSGRVLIESVFDNPQMSVGPDILTRIHHAGQDGGLKALQRLIIEGMNRQIDSLCRSLYRSAGIAPVHICIMSVAGNTAMTHLFMGLDPHWIIREPYIPVVNRPGTLRAADLGLRVHPGARIFIFPNIGSYFGGDLISGILFSGLHRREETAILVDVGTNAEVVLGNRNWLIGCAGAAGPALEGGAARMGMTAGPGVIDRVSIDPESRDLRIHTIDELAPRGICGSGLIDLAANLFLSGMIDVRGKFVPSKCRDRLKEKEGVHLLVMVPAESSATGTDLCVEQTDLDSLIRSKAAMYTILETVTMSVGMSLGDVSAFYVAGAFGAFIDPASAVTIGMMPDLTAGAYRSIGNSSLGGASMLLASPACMDEIDAIRDRITYLELNVNQEFMNRFSAAKFLPHTDLSRFPSVKPWWGKGFKG
jgi:uncharacterized 2Fe-2S/4Fe-4S cluster protein (DUF4445 family)